MKHTAQSDLRQPDLALVDRIDSIEFLSQCIKAFTVILQIFNNKILTENLTITTLAEIEKFHE